MKVYELMNALAGFPSGAEVFCSIPLTIGEVESGIVMDDADDKDNIIYEFSKPLDSVDSVDKNNSRIYLCF